jgi:hypothetical protein
MTFSMARRRTILAWLAAEPWQVFFGAFTSLQLGAPGVGARATWVPNLLVAEAWSLLPLGFAMAFWGRPAGRVAAIAVAVVMLAIAAVSSAALGRSPTESLTFFLFLALPPVLLLLAARTRP